MTKIPRTPIPVPAPPAGGGALRPEQLPGEGRPPMPTGEVVMTDYTRAQLTKLGWKPGDPVPGDLGQRIAEIRQQITLEKSQAAPAVPEGWQPVKPKQVDISELPEEHQQELREYLQTYKQQVEQDKARKDYEARLAAGVPEGASPSVAAAQIEAMRISDAAQAARASQRGNTTVEVIDDVEEVSLKPPPGVQIPEGHTYGGSLGQPSSLADKIEAAQAKQQQVQAAHEHRVAEEEAVPTLETGTLIPQARCPRCLWDMRMAFDAEPTDNDKQVFMAAVLGMQRFIKRVEIMGGKMAFTFRSLTTQESSTISRQLSTMIKAEEIKGDGEYFAMLMEYRLVLSLAKVEALGHVLVEVPEFLAWCKENPPDKTNPPPTQLPALRDWFYEHVMPQESLRRVVGQHHRQFQRVVEALEALTAESDFWTGIELPG